MKWACLKYPTVASLGLAPEGRRTKALLFFRKANTLKAAGGSHGSQVISFDPCSHCYFEQEIGQGTAGCLKGEENNRFLTPLSVIAERWRLLLTLKREDF